MSDPTPTSPNDRARDLRAPIVLLASLLLALAGCSGESDSTASSSKPPSKPSTAASSDAAAARPTPSPPPVEKPAAQPAAETAAASSADLAKRGRSVYMANCIACHSQNPAQDGALGPAVAGSSRELVEARVMRAEYPEGYTPKRPSKVMIALPHLASELDALTAYLNSESVSGS